MLRQILSITGRPGLYKIISQGSRALIVEDLQSGKRLPATQRDKVVSLGDIAMYTDSGDLPLGDILDRVHAHEKGELIDVKGLVASRGLHDHFGLIIEDFDRERVHDNDIKKLFTWYNILRGAGFDKFTEEDQPAESAETAEE